MSLVTGGMYAQLIAAAAAVLLAVIVPGATRTKARSALSGLACVALGVAGAIAGIAAFVGTTGSFTLNLAMPPAEIVGQFGAADLGTLIFAPDRVSGLFMAVAGIVGALAACYGIGYAHGPAASRTGWVSFATFMLAMQLLPATGDVVGFLLLWEVMALASTVLVLADYRHNPQVRSAGLWYAVLTHVSFLLIALGFAALVAITGSASFAGIAAAGYGTLTSGMAVVALILLLVGFATKAGMVPLHVWLPRAHPEAPSHVSALMSAAMVKMGIYGVLLVVIRLVPGLSFWWGVGLLIPAAVSAVYGILQASVATDIKRLLAYSTTENVGLIGVAIAVSIMTRAQGAVEVSQVALIAALLLVVSHAAFKTVLFLGAGAIVHATGERDMDQLGGLARRMPFTTFAFGAGCLGAASLPISSGFVSEWVLLQTLIHGDNHTGTHFGRLLSVLMPLAVAVVALTAGLALMTFVKAFGITFLARPRSDGAAEAQQVAVPMRVAMFLAAVAVIGLGFVPALMAPALADAVGSQAVHRTGVLGLDLPPVNALIDPGAIALFAAGLALPVLLLTAVLARRRKRRWVDLPWGCGGVRVSPRMQYTATSYAEPLVRVFDDVLKPARDVEVSHTAESRYLLKSLTFRQRVTDVIEDRVYQPLIRAGTWLGDAGRRVHNGSIHRYLAFSFTTLLVVLVVVTW